METIYLPDEAIHCIMAFMDSKSLLVFRLTSIKWNKAVCLKLRKSSDAIVHFQQADSDLMHKYLETFQSRIQDEIPYANYRITVGKLQPVCSFFDVIGPFVTRCTLDINASSSKVKVNMLLQDLPSLEILHVNATTLEKDTMYPPLLGQRTCSKLEIFQVKVHYKSAVVHEDSVLEGWVAVMPALKILNWEICIIFPSQKRFLEFVKAKKHYRSISLNVSFEQEVLFSPEDSEHLLSKMKLKIEVLNSNEKFCSNLMLNLNKLISGLTVALKEDGDNYELPEMPNLKYLMIRSNAIIKVAQFWSKNLPDLFPALKSVSLDFFNINTSLDAALRPHFQRLRFYTVESLQVNCGFDMNGSPYRPYHIIFPNIKSFTIEGSVVNLSHVTYIRNFLQQLEQLTIVSTSTQDNPYVSDLKDSLFFNENKDGRCAWAFSTLKGLKKLHIHDLHSQNLKSIILGMVALTYLEIIPPLQLLSFHGKSNGLEKLLLTKGTWHKCVQFQDSGAQPFLN